MLILYKYALNKKKILMYQETFINQTCISIPFVHDSYASFSLAASWQILELAARISYTNYTLYVLRRLDAYEFYSR